MSASQSFEPKPLGALTIGEWTYTFAYDENNMPRVYSPQGSCTISALNSATTAMKIIGFPPVYMEIADVIAMRKHLIACARYCFADPLGFARKLVHTSTS